MQRASTIIVQKSLKEGFGLTVTEALWKGKPTIAGAVEVFPRRSLTILQACWCTQWKDALIKSAICLRIPNSARTGRAMVAST